MSLLQHAANWDIALSRRRLSAPTHIGTLEARFLDLPQCRVRYCEAGSGPALVMLPDPPNTLEFHADLIAALAPHYRVVCFEFPGFGYSQPSRGFSFELDPLAATFAQIFDALHIRDALLAISCLGAYAGLCFSAKYPQYVRRLMLSQVASVDDAITWSHGADVGSLIATPFVGQVFTQLLQKPIYKQWYRSALNVQDEADPRYQAYLHRGLHAIEHGACFCLASAYQHLQRKTRLDLSEVRQPAMLLWGPNDPTHTCTKPQGLAQQLPDCRYVEFELSAHFPNLEEPERFVKLAMEADEPARRRNVG